MFTNQIAGALTETIKKEERSRERWLQTYGQHFQTDEQGNPIRRLPSDEDASAHFFVWPEKNKQATRKTATQGPSSLSSTAPSGLSSSMVMDETIGVHADQARVRKVVHQVEVPVTRRVAVPVKARRLVPQRVQKTVTTRRVVPVTSYEAQEQTYTDYEERPVVREKEVWERSQPAALAAKDGTVREVWLRKVLPEQTFEKVGVTKSRTVQVPVTQLREVEDVHTIEVEEPQVVEEDAYQISEVQDVKLLEIEEDVSGVVQPSRIREIPQGNSATYHLLPPSQRRPPSPSLRSQQQRRPPSASYARPASPSLRPPSPSVRPPSPSLAPTSTSRTLRHDRPGQSGSYHVTPTPTPTTTAPSTRGTSQTLSLESSRPASATATALRSRPATARAPEVARPKGGLGMKISDTDAQGVQVLSVTSGSPAAHAGLRVRDRITHVNNRPTRNVEEFKTQLAMAGRFMHVQLLRPGAGKLSTTVQRTF